MDIEDRYYDAMTVTVNKLTSETLRREEDVRPRGYLAALAEHLFGSLVCDVIMV